MKNTRESLLEIRDLIDDLIERINSTESPVPGSTPAAVPAVPEPAAPAAPAEVPAAESDPAKGRLGIVVGHTKAAQGAVGIAPISSSEYPWNKDLAEMIKQQAVSNGHACGIFFRDGGGIQGAYEQAEAFDSDAILELHFNAADGRAQGTETLRGVQPEAVEWAECVHEAMVGVYGRTGRLDRGIKRLKAGDRGQQSVSQSETVPTLIIEPFFGDNPDDARLGQTKKEALAKALASAFDRFLKQDSTPERSGGQAIVAEPAAAGEARVAQPLRQAMGGQIVKFEARRDSQGRIAVYRLPRGDGGGTYEVAGINDRYHPTEVNRLVALINAGKYAEAEAEAAEYIAVYTDRVQAWAQNPGVQFYLRDSAFNRGPGGAAKILQLAVGVVVDGGVGPNTRAAADAAGANNTGADRQKAQQLLQQLRAAREQYEIRYVGRREQFWRGLTNRWNNALQFALTLVDK